uniref:1-Cys peroxiredoxin n=1 Tax=Plectus sambesii TaxID=2011161 RepID=A0A914VA89_9BILA
MRLGDVFPDFHLKTNEGNIPSFHAWMGDSWAILFSHPADFTPICTTELSEIAFRAEEFLKRGLKMIALSCEGPDSHNKWIEDLRAYGNLPPGKPFPYPIICDENRDIAVRLGMLDPVAKSSRDAIALPCRAVFVIGPDKTLKLSILYPASTGRNINEILRVVDSLQLTVTHKVGTPVNWQPGDKCIVLPSVAAKDVSKLFPNGIQTTPLPSGKEYLRWTEYPGDKERSRRSTARIAHKSKVRISRPPSEQVARLSSG